MLHISSTKNFYNDQTIGLSYLSNVSLHSEYFKGISKGVI